MSDEDFSQAYWADNDTLHVAIKAGGENFSADLSYVQARLLSKVLPAVLDKKAGLRMDIVDVIGKHVDLRGVGNRLVGVCPFHEEISGSFMVDTAAQRFRCFGCRREGGVEVFLDMLSRERLRRAES